MTGIPRQDLAALLRDISGGGSFSTRRTAPVGDSVIEVRGVGLLRLPVTAGQAKELRLIARPARYGNGTETLLDRRVRDTWEVPRARVSIDQRRWANTIRPMLELIRDDLGLSASTSLDADLHSVLVYEPGQFFAAHQDSEKDDRMIGSLVVLLPSRSTGGDLVVSHRGQTVTYRGSTTALTFVAFYADTRHEVLPVETGYRIALTYNLRLSGDATETTLAPARSAVAADLMRQHFATPVAPRWQHDHEAGVPPDRLVFLLDHQYSEYSLRWQQLKGEDATRAAVLRDAADTAECEVALALAEIRETWDVEYVEYRRGRGGWSSWNDDGPDRNAVDALGSLIDSDIEIRPAEGRPVGSRHVADRELAVATPSVELEPYDTEYTGNMGNYGNTMDRWYRRAAVVVWPSSRAFALKAKGDPAGAVDELLTMTSDDSSEQERRADMVQVLLRFWPEGVRHRPDRSRAFRRQTRRCGDRQGWRSAGFGTQDRVRDPSHHQRCVRRRAAARAGDTQRRRRRPRTTAGHRLFPLYWLAAMTGMRRSEVLGLKWPDIDFAKKRLHLNRGLVAVGYEVHETRGKTKTARRAISLDDTTLAVLAVWRQFQTAEFAAVGIINEEKWVFTDGDGKPIHPHAVYEAFVRIVHNAGIPAIRFHDYADVRVMPMCSRRCWSVGVGVLDRSA